MTVCGVESAHSEAKYYYDPLKLKLHLGVGKELLEMNYQRVVLFYG
jgi:hypothetical protein